MSVADEPVPPSPDPALKVVIHLPEGTNGVPRDCLLMITSTKPLIILQVPDGGVLKIKQWKSPFAMAAKYADSDGDYEPRQYDQPFIWTVMAGKPGATELLLIPTVCETADEIVRRTLIVGGPRPPPDPEPDPNPNPQPKAETVSVAIVEDTMQRSPETAVLLNALVGWTEFVDAGNDWRLYDRTTGEAKGKEAIAELGPIKVPAIVIRDKTTRIVLHKGPIPATIGDLKKLIGGLTDG
jgi:hypothetical protein